MTNQLTHAEIYEALARLERERHPRPWEAFEVVTLIEGRQPLDSLEDLFDMLVFDSSLIRLKPQLPPMVERTIRYPEPMRKVLNPGQEYWVARPDRAGYCAGWYWTDSAADEKHLTRDLIHLTERNARAHGMALAGCSQDEIDAVLRGEDQTHDR